MKKHLPKILTASWFCIFGVLVWVACSWGMSWEIKNNSVGGIATRFAHGFPVLILMCSIIVIFLVGLGYGFILLNSKVNKKNTNE
jgi:hypothetical protein